MARERSRRRFSWEQQYTETVLETNAVRLGVRVKTLEAALLMRLLDLTGALEDQEESKAVEEALRNLAALKQERGIAWPMAQLPRAQQASVGHRTDRKSV